MQCFIVQYVGPRAVGVWEGGVFQPSQFTLSSPRRAHQRLGLYLRVLVPHFNNIHGTLINMESRTVDEGAPVVYISQRGTPGSSP